MGKRHKNKFWTYLRNAVTVKELVTGVLALSGGAIGFSLRGGSTPWQEVLFFVLSLGFVCFAIPTAFFDWRRKRANPAPIPELSVSQQDVLVYGITLRNRGGLASFWAEMEIVDTNAFSGPRGAMGALFFESWKDTRPVLSPGESDWIRIARAEQFTLFRYDPEAHGMRVVLDGRYFPENQAPIIIFDVTVMSDPPAARGPFTRRFRYQTSSQWDTPRLEMVEM